jgi:hypothetical protein
MQLLATSILMRITTNEMLCHNIITRPVLCIQYDIVAETTSHYHIHQSSSSSSPPSAERMSRSSKPAVNAATPLSCSRISEFAHTLATKSCLPLSSARAYSCTTAREQAVQFGKAKHYGKQVIRIHICIMWRLFSHSELTTGSTCMNEVRNPLIWCGIGASSSSS